MVDSKSSLPYCPALHCLSLPCPDMPYPTLYCPTLPCPALPYPRLTDPTAVFVRTEPRRSTNPPAALSGPALPGSAPRTAPSCAGRRKSGAGPARGCLRARSAVKRLPPAGARRPLPLPLEQKRGSSFNVPRSSWLSLLSCQCCAKMSFYFPVSSLFPFPTARFPLSSNVVIILPFLYCCCVGWTGS